jgi:hypothetical protein
MVISFVAEVDRDVRSRNEITEAASSILSRAETACD